MEDIWEVRNSDGKGVISSIPMCGYTDKELASLKAAGYKLYLNGKLYKKDKTK